MLATLGMGMGLRDASLVILFFALLTSIPPAFMGIGGMETGLRQLVQARYSFGCVNTAPLFSFPPLTLHQVDISSRSHSS